MDNYNRFAEIYDALMYDIDYVVWKEYFDNIFQRYGIEPTNLLEMACGTGNITVELAKSYKVMGFDLSEQMLVQAYEKLAGKKNVKLFHGDMTKFNLNREFDSVICACDSLNYITEYDDLVKSFANAYTHLKTGGLFIFDVNSYYKLSEVIGNNTFTDEVDDLLYVWQNEFVDDIANFSINYFAQVEDGLYERFSEVHRERAYTVEQIVDGLKTAGFGDIEYYEAFTFNEIKKNTQRINFVARK